MHNMDSIRIMNSVIISILSGFEKTEQMEVVKLNLTIGLLR